jgi:hypothetical protein
LLAHFVAHGERGALGTVVGNTLAVHAHVLLETHLLTHVQRHTSNVFDHHANAVKARVPLRWGWWRWRWGEATALAVSRRVDLVLG